MSISGGGVEAYEDGFTFYVWVNGVCLTSTKVYASAELAQDAMEKVVS